MDGTITLSVALVFSVIAASGTLYNIYNGQRKNKDEENERKEEEKNKSFEMEKNFLKLDLKMDNVIGATNTILEKQEKQAIRIEQLSGEIIKSNEKITTLFKYKDDHEERLKRLESKS